MAEDETIGAVSPAVVSSHIADPPLSLGAVEPCRRKHALGEDTADHVTKSVDTRDAMYVIPAEVPLSAARHFFNSTFQFVCGNVKLIAYVPPA